MSCTNEWNRFMAKLDHYVNILSRISNYKHECAIHNLKTACEYAAEAESILMQASRELNDAVAALSKCIGR
jgi:hypothetical protein